MRVTSKELQPHLTRGLQFALDVAMLVAAFVLAYLLRFEFAVPEKELRNAVQQLPYVVLVQLGALALAGVYSFIWRYVGLGEVKAFIYAAVWSALVLAVLRLSLPHASTATGGCPSPSPSWGRSWRSEASSGCGSPGATSTSARRAKIRAAQAGSAEKQPTLLIGAGRAGVLAAREIEGRGDMSLEVKGFVDDDPEKRGAVIHGFRVLGSTGGPAPARQGARDHPGRHHDRPDLPAGDPAADRSLPEDPGRGPDHPRPLRRAPGQGPGHPDPQRPDRGPPGPRADLPRRGAARPVPGGQARDGHRRGRLDRLRARRQVARFQPAKLLLVERAEFALFEIDRELRRTRARDRGRPARRRRLRRGADARGLRRAPARRSSSTRRRTSTCR